MTVVERGSAAAEPRRSRRAPDAADGSGDAVDHGTAAGGPDGVAARQRRDERRTVTVAFAAALIAFVPTAAGAYLVAGGRGLLGAMVGTLLVLVLFAMGAALMLWAGRRGPSMMTMAAASGVGARLMIYAAVLTALDGTDMVHRPSLAVATVVTLIITLAGEIVVLSRTPSLFRLQVPPTAPTARPLAAGDRAGPHESHGTPHREHSENPDTTSEARDVSTDVSTDRSTAS